MNNFIQKVSAITLILSGVVFAGIAILAIWEVIANDDLTWKSLGTLAAIALGSLIVNMGARIFSQNGRR